jgi:hemerythrin-like domain-containing protein
MKTKPIKRSPELTDLSRDHHEGLLLCWKIRAGIRSSIALDRIVAYVLYFFQQDLKEHFSTEENVLFSHLPDGDILIKEAITQHEELRNIAGQLTTDTAQADMLLSRFADGLEHHIRFEERELFPYIEEKLSPTDLLKAGKHIADEANKKVHLKWADEFWIKRS